MWNFGIRVKVALLVFVATAASAFLAAQLLSRKGHEVLRDHELVDLGDEAALRGWELDGRIQGLLDDIADLADDSGFNRLVAEGADGEQLVERCRQLCRRNWNRHLRIDILHGGEEEDRLLVSKASLRAEEGGAPDLPEHLWNIPDGVPAYQGVFQSSIQRFLVTRRDLDGVGELERWEPVIWAVAPLDADAEGGAPVFVRILMSLYTSPSPRQLFTLHSQEGDLLVRHDETAPADSGNDALIQSFAESEEVREKFEESIRFEPGSRIQRSKVDRVAFSGRKTLPEPYYFQEGLPSRELRKAIDAQPEEEFEAFFDRMQTLSFRHGHLGGLHSKVGEIRMLARSRDQLVAFRREVEEMLAEEYGAEAAGIRWRSVVECDDIFIWAVRLIVGDNLGSDRYLIYYAAFDDELASSIAHEMGFLRLVASAFALAFGALGFLLAMRFIQPLERMTVAAQKITESKPEKFHDNLGHLVKQLDVRRRDEFGDIARASKRLFEELIQFNQGLEQRVLERTREVRRANTELEKANEKLMSLSREKDAFVAKVSHDLRQPLNAIFLQVEALKLSELDEVQRDDVERIHGHAKRELNLVNDILEYQKIIMGAESLNRDTVDIACLIRDLDDAHRATAEDRGLAFRADCPGDIGHLIADDRRLRQILGNLLHNACKFTKEGSIVLAVSSADTEGGDWVEFSVADSGRGMSPEEQARAFQPFVSNKTDNAGGTGLGLSICKELTEQMGGKIGFVSELGKGTEFTVTLPREPDSEHYRIGTSEGGEEDSVNGLTVPAEPGQPLFHDERPRSGTILVIDDDRKVRKMLRDLLEQEGHAVIEASSGERGVELARGERPDAITLDVFMPGGIDGWETLRELKEHPGTEAIPVVMVTCDEQSEHSIALDVEDYLVKPVDVDRLRRVIARLTEQSMQRNILLVDDEADTLQSLSRILRKAGWQTTLATDGEEALAALGITRPAAIVLDLMMPGMDGFAFLREMRKQSHLRSIPVIVMSGKDPSDDERDFLRENATSVLAKGPRSGRDLLDCIRERLG